MSPIDKLNELKKTGIQYHKAIEPYIPLLFFVGGFIFDLFTLGKIDHWSTLLQQGLFILIISVILFYKTLNGSNKKKKHKWIEKCWAYHVEALHFLLGGLLNAYLIYYFKSGTFSSSFLFLTFIAIVLVLNETKAFQELGLTIKYLLLCLCSISFFLVAVPSVIGSLGILSFILSIFCFLAFHGFIGFLLFKFGLSKKKLMNKYVIPIICFVVFFINLYVLNYIPPIPLSVKYIGMFHSVERVDGQYKLGFKKKWWQFFQNGSQDLVLKADDKVYCFLRIYSPARFSDKIYLKWFYKNGIGDWEAQDKIPIPISGGRDDGFRGFTYKQKHKEGEWKVHVLTEGNQELSRVYFSIKYGEDKADYEYELH